MAVGQVPAEETPPSTHQTRALPQTRPRAGSQGARGGGRRDLWDPAASHLVPANSLLGPQNTRCAGEDVTLCRRDQQVDSGAPGGPGEWPQIARRAVGAAGIPPHRTLTGAISPIPRPRGRSSWAWGAGEPEPAGSLGEASLLPVPCNPRFPASLTAAPCGEPRVTTLVRGGRAAGKGREPDGQGPWEGDRGAASPAQCGTSVWA